MTALERLQESWIRAGYPKGYMPKEQFNKVAESVAHAFAAGEEDYIRAGWERAGVDYPFVPSHPRYQEMLKAYRELAPH